MRPTYELPSALRNALKRVTYHELNERFGVRQEALSVARRRGRISRESYEHLIPYFEEAGLAPPAWSDLVDLANVDLKKTEGEELFEEIRSLYLKGQAKLAIAKGQQALRHRKAGTWFFGGWALLSIANRIGQPSVFTAVVRSLQRRVDDETKLPPESLRMCAADIAKWLLENGCVSESKETYAHLITRFEPNIDSFPPGVASSLLRGYGTLCLLRRLHTAQEFYGRALALAAHNPEGKLGTLNWRARASELVSSWQKRDDTWEQLRHETDQVTAGRRAQQISAETLISARLTLCLHPENVDRPRQLQELLDDCAQWSEEKHSGHVGFILRGTPLADLATVATSPSTKATLQRLVRQRVAPENIEPVVALQRSLLELAALND